MKHLILPLSIWKHLVLFHSAYMIPAVCEHFTEISAKNACKVYNLKKIPDVKVMKLCCFWWYEIVNDSCLIIRKYLMVKLMLTWN